MGLTSSDRCAMSEGKFTIRAKKFISNPLLARKQCVLEVIHPSSGNVSKKSLREKLATAYKISDVNCVHVFGMKTAFGGGRSTGFALMYDNLAAAKKFEPKHRLKRVGLDCRRRPAVATARTFAIASPSFVERRRGRPQ